jgi:hypothetical protein
MDSPHVAQRQTDSTVSRRLAYRDFALDGKLELEARRGWRDVQRDKHGEKEHLSHHKL